MIELFEPLDYWEAMLGQQCYLCGVQITLADWCMFTTLFRFDLAYYGLFKCNLKRLVDYPNLWNYFRDLYQKLNFDLPHNRDRRFSTCEEKAAILEG